jgi:hypothetical protein
MGIFRFCLVLFGFCPKKKVIPNLKGAIVNEANWSCLLIFGFGSEKEFQFPYMYAI